MCPGLSSNVTAKVLQSLLHVILVDPAPPFLLNAIKEALGGDSSVSPNSLISTEIPSGSRSKSKSTHSTTCATPACDDRIWIVNPWKYHETSANLNCTCLHWSQFPQNFCVLKVSGLNMNCTMFRAEEQRVVTSPRSQVETVMRLMRTYPDEDSVQQKCQHLLTACCGG